MVNLFLNIFELNAYFDQINRQLIKFYFRLKMFKTQLGKSNLNLQRDDKNFKEARFFIILNG